MLGVERTRKHPSLCCCGRELDSVASKTNMTRTCCAVNCANKSKDGFKMFNIPRGSHPFHKNRRRLWLQVIKRADWGSSGPNGDMSLCSAHFISGAPSMDYDSPDFVPSIFSHSTRDNQRRYKRKRIRDENKGPQMETDPLESPEDQCVESRVQVKMNSPDSIKQEEPEDHPHLNILHMVVCKEEVPAEQERSPSLLQEETEPPHIKEEQEELKEEEEELLQRPEEPDGSMLTLIAVKSEEKDDDEEDISSHCFEIEVELESDTEVTDDWEKTTRSLCDKSFSESGRPKNRQRVHTGEKPFHCNLCCRSFSEEGVLKMHLRIHNHCKYCDRSFSNLHELKQHIEHKLVIPGGETGEQGRERDKIGEREGVRSQSSQPQFFSCSECSYALTSQVFLHKHIRLRHSDLYCQMLRNGQITDRRK